MNGEAAELEIHPLSQVPARVERRLTSHSTGRGISVALIENSGGFDVVSHAG